MAGLLDPNAQQQMPQEQMPPEQQPMPPAQEQLPPEEMPPEEMPEQEADENNPAFQQALYMAKQALYEDGAADTIHEQIKGADDPVEMVANIAYDMTAIVDERTEGEVPDELLVLLASSLLEEVADIAEASGITLTNAEIAKSMKLMILRFVGDQGHDTRELQAAMDQVSDEDIEQMISEQPDEDMPEEDMPEEEPQMMGA
jgi:hypothetical protein